MTNFNSNSYRQIMKATSIFGGSQVVNIIVSIIRSKALAVFLGPAGLGIATMITTSLSLISGITNLGLGVSAVKDVAQAHSAGDEFTIRKISTVIDKWFWLTGILGFTLTFLLSPLLSYISFGSWHQYTLSFAVTAVTLLVNQLNAKMQVILQGTRNLMYLAKSNVLGNIAILFLTLPLYFFFGLKAITASIVLSSLVTYMFTRLYYQKIASPNLTLTKLRIFAEGKKMVQLGFVISLSGLITLASSYIVRLAIGRFGSIEDLGLFNAGFAIINTYVGLVFTAMGTDYYPRLSGNIEDVEQSNTTVNQQAEIALLIMGPILVAFIVFSSEVINILYSNAFLKVDRMIIWAAVGMLWKAASWSVGYLILAKGNSKLFFRNELIANIYILALNIMGYVLWGLSGLGISFLIGYGIYFFQVLSVSMIYYHYRPSKMFAKILGIYFMTLTAAVVSSYRLVQKEIWLVGSIILCAAIVYSYAEMNKRIHIVEFVRSKISKK